MTTGFNHVALDILLVFVALSSVARTLPCVAADAPPVEGTPITDANAVVPLPCFGRALWGSPGDRVVVPYVVAAIVDDAAIALPAPLVMGTVTVNVDGEPDSPQAEQTLPTTLMGMVGVGS